MRDITENKQDSALRRCRTVEWPTVVLLALCYGVFAAASYFAADIGYVTAFPLMAVAIALHSSLQHEVLHGHPTRNAAINEALVFLPLPAFHPYRRFKTLHLRHHRDERLTDPYDDPESFYVAAGDYSQVSPFMRGLLNANNTLAGRLTVGPALMILAFAISEARLITAGDRKVMDAWLRHLAGLALLALWIQAVCGIPFGLYLLVPAYLGMSLIAVRTFCEHRWEHAVDGRTIIVEKARIFGPLFLNNNLHLVHHKLPTLPWYRLPAAFRARRDEWVAMNNGYVYRSYADIARQWLLKRKEPVVHPAWRTAVPPEPIAAPTVIQQDAAVPAAPPTE